MNSAASLTTISGRAPWLVALLLLVFLLSITLWLHRSFGEVERQQIERYFDTIVEHIEADLVASASQHTAIQSRMASRLAFDGPFDEAAWQSDARRLMKDHPHYRFLGVLEGDFLVRWALDAGNAGPLPGQIFGFSAATRQRLAGHSADMTEVVVTTEFDGTEPMVVLVTPVSANDQIVNWLVAVQHMSEGISSMLTGFYLRDVVLSGGIGSAAFEIAASELGPVSASEYQRAIDFEFADGAELIEVMVKLREERLQALRGGMAETVLIFGISMSLMIALAAFLAMASSRQARAVDMANRDLRSQIHDRELAERELEFLLTHDPLTELPNRQGLLRNLERLFEQVDEQRCLAVMLIDLDQFKDVNETLGHDLGDALLREVAGRLQQELADADVLGRFGGDEFMVVVVRNKCSQITRLADHLLHSLEEPFQIEQHQLFVTASMGLAFHEDESERPSDLIRNADAAMFRAKQQGRNRHARFSSDMFDQVEYRLNLSRDIRAGIQAGEFRLAYQPIVDLETLEIRGAEALMRWTRENGQEVPPEDFIRVAEETGLVNRLTRFALNQALQDLSSWKKTLGQAPCWISVNISGAQFREPGFVEVLSQLLHQYRVQPDELHLEITEEVLIENLERNRDLLQRIDRIGIPIVVDDFGVGYSSLAYIKNFPVSLIKIDKGFVFGLEEDPEDRAITRTICELAGELDLQTVAEGIEQQGQLDLLRRFGCRLGQGFLFSPAVAGDQLLDMVRGRPPWSGMTCPVPDGTRFGAGEGPVDEVRSQQSQRS
ncbi:MAG: putative bifunctional diguanylate cyclase/phosphodiesterase [Wenzhouxiangellaceae bacterium]